MTIMIIELENMEFQAFHGCYPMEQIVGNKFSVDVAVEADLGAAALSDDVGDSINYLDVYEVVGMEMAKKSKILENVAARIAGAIHDRFPMCRRVTVKVSKLAPPLGGKIGKVSVTYSE